MRKCKGIFLGLLVVVTTLTYGQHQLKQKGEFGFGGGLTNYIGDLKPTFNFSSQKPAFNAFFRKNISQEYLTFRGNLLFGFLGADESKQADPYQQNRSASFNSSLTELALTLEYNFFDFRSEHDLKIRRIHSPYVFGGMIVSTLSGETTGPSGIESGFGAAFTYGVGLKVKISHYWNIGGDIGIRHTYSDLLDGYTDQDLGNTSSKNDHYLFTGIYLSYSILENSCPEPSRGSLNKK